MGSSQSTRKLSVNNDNVIQISEAALQRLENRPVVVSPYEDSSRHYRRDDGASGNEEYWKKRIDDLKKTHDIINTKMNAEYNDAVVKTAELFQSSSSKTLAGKLPPCQNFRKEKPRRKPRRKWTTATMTKAVNECLSGGSFQGTARKYNLPIKALATRVKADERYKSGPRKLSSGLPPMLTPEEDDELIATVNEMAKAFHCEVNSSFLAGVAWEYSEKLQKKRPSTGRSFYTAWARRFITKHTNTILKKSEVLSTSNLASAYQESLAEFYSEIKSAMLRHKFQPSRIYNVDELSFTVYGEMEETSTLCEQRPSSSRQEINNISLCCCMNAVGSFIPPMFAYPKCLAKTLMVIGYLGSIHTFSNDGWMNKELFNLWLHFFVAYTKASVEDPVLLVVDNHVSHISLNAYTFARNNGVIIVSMPSIISDKVQPLLLAVFDPLRKAFLDRYNSQFTSQDIPTIITNSYLQVSTTENAVGGFAKSGIYPLNCLIPDAEPGIN